ncbi:MAG: lipoate--protein ligase [Ruminococcaceae bacterium]|nr:lipoate--protein ligase [Oscillospiraceae bacterium]
MLFIVSDSFDPYYNLAAEEFLMKERNEEVFMLWRNDNTIVIGRNQNTLAEINYDYVKEQNIRVVRRMTGGGAVYHDMGNINFTFIVNSEKDFSNYDAFTAPIIGFLQSLGVDARLKGRNDLVIEDKKISGNAQYMHKGRMLHHGTLLYDARQNKLSQALAVSEEKIKSKGIQSVRSRVTNIGSYLKEPPPAEQFMKQLADYMVKSIPDCQYYDIHVHDEAITKLRDEKYATWEWNFGYSPRYAFSAKKRFPFGEVEIHLQTGREAVIEEAKIYGDFFSRKPIDELAERLCGLRHEANEIEKLLTEIVVSDYIDGMSTEDFLTILF